MKGKIAILAVLVFIVSFAIEARVVDWKYVDTGESALHYYNPQSIKWVSKDIVRVREKISYREKAFRAISKSLGLNIKN